MTARSHRVEQPDDLKAADLFSLDDYDRVIGFVISQAAEALSRQLIAIIERNGISITPREFVIINRLWQFQSLTQSQLVNLSYKDPAATSRLVESLRKKGLVTRKTSPSDRRVTDVKLTEKGSAVRSILAPQISEMLRSATAHVDEADLLAAFRVMKAIAGSSETTR